ncbi:CpaF family protein [Desulfovirgula thermocuniculi]|uniref:CpaF family protein n=1 Tax=Desulfovirgula thermocuniculi TaxID=348842 RepID=UPI00040D8DD9|nr:ATPase, T2SS/T4P/T4SS family [Desulfovirgula thermocuniculi]
MDIRDVVTAVRRRLAERGPAGEPAEEFVRKEVRAVLGRADPAVEREVLCRLLGLGPIEPLLADPEVSEIMVNGPHQIYVERNGAIELTGLSYTDGEELMNAIYRIMQFCGRRINFSSPLEDARLPDGSRVNAVVPPVTDYPVLTIRKFVRKVFRTADLLQQGSISPDMVWFFEAAVKGKANTVVCGATSSGKTTFLRWLTTFLPKSERIITIEDMRELNLDHPHCVAMEATDKADIHRLTVNALRMRPDRIIIGEVRGAEAFELLQAMGTGHEGSLTTVHANYTVSEAVHRLIRAMIRAGGVTAEELEYMICETIELFVFVKRLPDGTRRVVRVAEVEGWKDGPVARDIFIFRDGTHRCVSPVSGKLARKLRENMDAELPDIPAFGSPVDH